MHGMGTILLPDGSEYVGQWKLAKAHGIGTYRNSMDELKKGEWSEGKCLRWLVAVQV